ncbi:hypothetical protein KUTeg_019928 [Tegillarca granosa]|uniref:Uncharacterized protein n=1 Tax=Tegillarca granosa TaxID=220873 RepID=A0ABQ9EDY8_TEGGR|nr:hypothetical protein KUTeg_019928 [Tegillarca granosa]
MITKSGAEYAYLKEAFGPLHATLGPIPAFLFAWTSVLILKPALFGVVAMSFAVYTTEPFFPCDPPPFLVPAISVICLRSTEYLSEGFEDTTKSPSLVALAFYDGLWAYDGWNNLNYVTEEIINPFVLGETGCLVWQPSLCLFQWHSLHLVLLMVHVLLVEEFLFPFMYYRVMYVAAREGHLPEVLSYVHAKQCTPMTSLVLSTVIAIIMVLTGDIFSLIDFFSFAAWMFYGGTMAALLVLRCTKRNAHRPYKVPIVVPLIVLICSCYLVVAPIIQDPRIEFLYAALFMFSGLFFYVPFVVYKKRLAFVAPVTRFIQMILWVAPSRYEPPE